MDLIFSEFYHARKQIYHGRIHLDVEAGLNSIIEKGKKYQYYSRQMSCQYRAYLFRSNRSASVIFSHSQFNYNVILISTRWPGLFDPLICLTLVTPSMHQEQDKDFRSKKKEQDKDCKTQLFRVLHCDHESTSTLILHDWPILFFWYAFKSRTN